MGTRSFPELLRLYRERAGVSQARLARLVGVDHSYVSRLERGVRNPSRELVVRIADALALGEGDRNALLLSAGFAPLLDPGLEQAASLLEDNRVPAEIRMALRQAIQAFVSLAERVATQAGG